MKRSVMPLLLLLGWLPSLASAVCFTVYDRANWIIYRATVTPIDLSGPISQAMWAKFPTGHLVISDGTTTCTRIDPRSPVDPMTGAAGPRSR